MDQVYVGAVNNLLQLDADIQLEVGGWAGPRLSFLQGEG